MARNCILLVFAALTGLLLGIPALADNGAFAFAVPAERIVVDGDLGDWPESTDRHWIRSVQHFDYPTGPEDGFFSVQAVYRVDEQAIYFGFEVHDDSESTPVESAPEFQDRLGLSLDLEPLVEGEKGDDSFNYYFHIRRDFSGWMDRILSDWTPIDGVASIAHRYGGGIWWVEVRIDVAALSDGRATIRPGAQVGVDFEFYDVDQDGTSSNYYWGRGVGRYEEKAYGDLFFLAENESMSVFSGRIDSANPPDPLLRDILHLRSLEHPDWPPLMLVCDAEGSIERMLPEGSYSTIAATPDRLVVSVDTDEPQSHSISLNPHEGTKVALLADSPLVRNAPAWGEEGEWLRVKLRDLFPGVRISALAVDEKDQLWIGSNLGLFAYDGFDYIHYPLLEAGSLSFDQMAIDPSGRLWIADVRRGVYRFENGHLLSFDLMDPALLRLDDLVIAEDGALWLGGMLGMVCFQGERFRLVEAIGNYRIAAAKSIAISSQGSVWVAGPSNRLHRYFNGRLEEVPGWQQDRALLRASYGSLGVDSANHVYLNGHKGQLLRYSDAVTVDEIKVTEMASLGESVVELEVHGKNRIWVGGGDVHRVGSDGVSLSGSQSGLQFSEVNLIACGSGDRVWVASAYDGIARFRNENVERISLPENLSSITAAVSLGERDWLLGTDSSGLVRVRDGACTILTAESTQNGLIGDHITVLEGDHSGGAWVGTSQGVSHLGKDGLWRSWETVSGTPGERVTAMAVSQKGLLCVGMGAKLHRFDGQKWSQLNRHAGDSKSAQGSILGLMWEDDERLWIASSTGLSVWKEERFAARMDREELMAGLPREIGVSSDPLRYWVGTGGSGVYRYDGDPSLGRYKRFSIDQGLSDVEVTCMLHDSLGRTWVGTKSGLNRIQDQSVVSLGVHDGLPSAKISDLVDLEDGSILVLPRFQWNGEVLEWAHDT